MAELGLSELINKVKQDLLSSGTDNQVPPLFSVDEVTLELAVTVY